MDSRTIVANIRRILKEKGLKQKAIAIKIKKSEKEFSNMLNFRTKIGAVEIGYIANALEVDVNELYKTD